MSGDPTVLGLLADEWEDLRAAVAARGGPRGPFLSAAWFRVTADTLAGPGTGRSVRIVTARRAGRLVGALPLLTERRRIGGVPTRVWRSLSDDHSQRFDVLLRDPDLEVADALLDALLERRGWDVLELRDVPDPPAAAGAHLVVEAARRRGLPLGTWASQVSPTFRLPTTRPALEAGLDAKHRANVRRRGRNLAKELGPLRLEVVEGGAGLDAAVDEGLALEAAGWKGSAGTAIACDPTLRARYHALAREFAGRGALCLYFLRAGPRRVAFHFALREDGVYYLFKPGFDPSLSRYGLGHLLLLETAADLIARGFQEIDLLGDQAEWKREWAAHARRHTWHTILRPSPYGRALHAWKFRLVPSLRRLQARLPDPRRPAAERP